MLLTSTGFSKSDAELDLYLPSWRHAAWENSTLALISPIQVPIATN